jgi:hypothetical protein
VFWGVVFGRVHVTRSCAPPWFRVDSGPPHKAREEVAKLRFGVIARVSRVGPGIEEHCCFALREPQQSDAEEMVATVPS